MGNYSLKFIKTVYSEFKEKYSGAVSLVLEIGMFTEKDIISWLYDKYNWKWYIFKRFVKEVEKQRVNIDYEHSSDSEILLHFQLILHRLIETYEPMNPDVKQRAFCQFKGI